MRADLPNVDSRMLVSEWSQRRLIGIDVMAAIAFGVLMAMSSPGSNEVGWLLLLVVVTAAPLAVRRLWPLPVFLVTLFGGVTSTILGIGSGLGLVAAAFGLYAVACEMPSQRREPTVVLATATLGVMVLGAIGGSTLDVGSVLGQVILGVAAMGVAWTWGRYVQQRKHHEYAFAQQLARTSVVEERVRIARELHDIVAHALSLITVKASVARHVGVAHPDEAGDALEVIESTSRSAMKELRTLVAVLRLETPETVHSHRVSDVPSLVEQAQDGDVAVELRIEDVHNLPEGLQTAMYRIVQEALTNVVRHAPGSSGHVLIEREGDDFCVEVANTPSPLAAGRPRRDGVHRGRGLMGMRERAVMYGGTIDAGVTPDGGFRVRALFPDPGIET